MTANNPQIRKVKDSEIITIMLSFPNLSVAEIANKLQIKYSELRYRIDKFKQVGILKREGARKNGRWVVTPKFEGCTADGQAIVKEMVELDPLLEAKLQKVADSKGVPVEIAMTQLIHEAVNKKAKKDEVVSGFFCLWVYITGELPRRGIRLWEMV